MPRYVYKCKNCHDTFQITHGMKESLTDCEKCETQNGLIKEPSLWCTYDLSKIPEKQKAGNLVKEFIERSTEDLKAEKERLIARDFDK
jgi:putative FmdB family regulatory protein